jgi:hypothetical protein
MQSEFYTKSKKVVDTLLDTFRGGNTIRNISNKGGSITQISSSGSINVNGKSYKGNNIQINGDRVIIDGEVQEGSLSGPEVTIIVEGDCGDISTEFGDITVKGTSKDVKTHNGQVTVGGNISGNVKTHNGNVKVSGSINGDCKTHNGNISK